MARARSTASRSASSAIRRARSAAWRSRASAEHPAGHFRPILQQPEIYLNGVGDAFDDKGELTKEALQKVMQQYIDAFAACVEKQNK